MDEIYKAQDYIKDFVSKTILPNYKFNDWKESLVLKRNKDNGALLKKMGYLYKKIYTDLGRA